MAGRNNIFAIDFDAVVQAIKDANNNLALRHSELMAARDRMPKELCTNDEVVKAKKFAEHLRKHASQIRSTRLSDTKPLRELVKRVESYFKEMEGDAKSAQETVLEALGDKARQPFASPGVSQEGNPIGKSFLIDSNTGEVLGSTSRTSEDHSLQMEEIRLSWEIDSIDREAIDLEALREHLTDSALMNAARKHLKTNGPNSLQGASYKRVAVL